MNLIVAIHELFYLQHPDLHYNSFFDMIEKLRTNFFNDREVSVSLKFVQVEINSCGNPQIVELAPAFLLSIKNGSKVFSSPCW